MNIKNHFDVIIIGSGPAGYSAAIYTGRANLRTLVIEGIERGGQLMITTDVENFPGFPDSIAGPELMEKLREQAARFGADLLTSLADEVILKDGAPFKVRQGEDWFSSESVIIATGATARFLGIPSEAAFKGKGVSACATCDGFFYRGKEVIVVGGGDSAMEEAVFLTKFANKVTIVHRRDEFRASRIMVERAKKNPKIEILTFQAIDEIFGNELSGVVNSVRLKDTQTGETMTMPVDGIFIAVGHDPNTKLFEGLLELNEEKYIITKPNRTATSIHGVFAAGDVQDDYYRQAITAAGSGAQAGIEVTRFLDHKD